MEHACVCTNIAFASIRTARLAVGGGVPTGLRCSVFVTPSRAHLCYQSLHPGFCGCAGSDCTHLARSTATMYDRKQHVHGVATCECRSECGVTRLFSCVRASCRPVTQNGAGHGQRSTEYDVHPDYPVLRPVVPLTYSLTMKACLRQHAMERPTFDQILELLRDVVKEVARGRYLDGDGRLQVNFPPSPGTLSPADGVY